MNNKNKKFIREVKRKVYELDAKSISFYRKNPCIACEDLLGIKLFDAQRWMLQSSWNASHIMWCCSRNFGKSFLGAILMTLKAILYENQAIYIISSVGDQSKETFSKIEEIVLRLGKTAASIRSLKDIVEKETVKSSNNKTGFNHNPSGYRVSFYNGSEIVTLNSNPDSNRSRRATMCFFDEAAFCADELITVCEAFATQNTEFSTSIDSNYDPQTEKRKIPTQLVYASSQDSADTLFYKYYVDFSKKMIAGDRNYFVCDMTCDTAINTYMDGKPYIPLLTQDKVDSAIKSNREKAMREYYNDPTRDGGASQIIKWGTIRRNESFYLPTLTWKPDSRIAIAFDPARTTDNSIIGVMNIYKDDKYGWCGDVINCINLIDVANKNKYKLDSNSQLKELQKIILDYNGSNPDYEFIDSVSIDAGAGGAGIQAYSDRLLNNWFDKSGYEHRGLIDLSYELYDGYGLRYPDAIDKLILLNPKKYRTQMVEEFIDLMNLGVIRFPFEYGGQDVIPITNSRYNEKLNEETMEMHELSFDEKMALINLDLMKTEITSIHKTTNSENTAVQYALAKDKERSMHDDRFYVMIMLAHRLWEIRRGAMFKEHDEKSNSNVKFLFRAPKIRKRG